jgi:hypothetical protein
MLIIARGRARPIQMTRLLALEEWHVLAFVDVASDAHFRWVNFLRVPREVRQLLVRSGKKEGRVLSSRNPNEVEIQMIRCAAGGEVNRCTHSKTSIPSSAAFFVGFVALLG